MRRRSHAPVVVGVLSALCFGLLIVALVLFTGGSGETNGQHRSGGGGSTRYTPEELQDLARPIPRMRMTQEQLERKNRADAEALKDWVDPNSDWHKQVEKTAAEYRAAKLRENRGEEARGREALEEWGRQMRAKTVPRKPGF